MFDFLKKKDIWDACSKGYLDEIKSKNISYQLKTAQDLSIYRLIRNLHDLDIAEIGGGNSRILERLAINNRCANIEKFEGKHLGPAEEIKLANVRNINSYVGDFDAAISDSQFDVIFSISVVEHVETERLNLFFIDLLRMLRPGGKFFHAIDVYLQDFPTSSTLERVKIYQSWVLDNEYAMPVGNVLTSEVKFTTDMISNPDNILYGWNTLVPSLVRVREASQSVSLIVAGMKL
ncbi:methyltransferase domain-containing protein [Synechococcus sp. BA-120 BA3]|nr:methyltransferase domain-containing protein [Synechococcus sp. BA-120 BA3]